MMKWNRTSRLSIKNSLSQVHESLVEGRARERKAKKEREGVRGREREIKRESEREMCDQDIDDSSCESLVEGQREKERGV